MASPVPKKRDSDSQGAQTGPGADFVAATVKRCRPADEGMGAGRDGPYAAPMFSRLAAGRWSLSVASSSSSSPSPHAGAQGIKARHGNISTSQRKSVRQRLAAALGGDELARSLAPRIEGALFEQLAATRGAYQRQARSLLFNIRGDLGAEVREAVRGGSIPVQVLPAIHTEDLAPACKRQERAKVRREAMEACEADWDLRRSTDDELNGQFTCGKCQGNRTWYFQFQTRACDEPMEFFVMCRDCRHGWRHNDTSPDDIFRQVWTGS